MYLHAHAQYALCGHVSTNLPTDQSIEVSIIENHQSVPTNKEGNFCFLGLSPGVYNVMATSEDFVSPIVKVLVNEDVAGVVLEIASTQLDTVSIKGEGKKELKSMHSIKTEIVDLTASSLSAVSVEQLMNRSAGIRIRNTGGLGADADVLVGGFNGKSIKFLVDGIPIDYLGSSMSLTKFPVEAADYIEIYKGVMPTEIGVDALGGAINIVTKKPTRSSSNYSYEAGSFNTHRLTINSFVRKSQKWSFGVNAFANYSANNFKVDNLPLADETTGRTQYITARLFHNKYRQYSAEAFFNIENRKWADMLKFKLNSYALKRDVQNDFVSRSRAFGGVYSTEHGYLIPSVEYKKAFLDKRLSVSQFLVYSQVVFQLVDSVKNVRYDWLGNKHQAVSGSEMGIDLTNLSRPVIETVLHNLTYRGLFTYRINENQKLIFNVVDNYFNRVADDLNRYLSKTHVRYNRVIAGLGYQYYFWDNRLEGLTQVKYLASQTKGSLANAITGEVEVPVQNSGWSFAQSLKYRSYNGWLVRASVENTYRLPDQMEIFGDNVFILPNIKLKPEKSLNVNFGIRYEHLDLFKIELSTYYRNTKDLIRLKDVSQFQSLYLNLDKVKGYGIEIEAVVKPIKQLSLSGNLTYNEFRYHGSNMSLDNNNHFLNARVSNMPFYFGNAMATYQSKRLFTKDKRDFLQLYWSYSYVHQFYLDFIEKQFEPDGFLGLFGKSKVYTDRVIPIQQIHSAGFIWKMKLKKSRIISVSSECSNLFNKPVYNTFKMQSAGRSFTAKISYSF